MIRRSLVSILALALGLPALALAQGQVPDAGLAAEGNGQWEEALSVYGGVLQVEPMRADLWVRVADIQARLGRSDEAAAALLRATQAAPGDATLHYRLSQAYAMTNKPEAAIASADRAMQLAPGEPQYLRQRASLASWVGDYGRAVTLYNRYLAMQGDDGEAWLALARAQSWRGNATAAIGTLDIYRSRFGDTPAYSLALGQVLASGGRPSHALDVLDPMYRDNPAGYEVNVARTVALAMQRSVPAAFDSLAAVRRLDATRAETRAAERLLRASIGSSVDPGASFYNDSDDLEITRIAPSVSVMVPASGTQLSAGYERQILRAPRANGLGLSTGQAAIHEVGWGRVAQGIGPVTVTGSVGRASAERFDKTPYSIAARLRASDAFSVGVEQSDEFLVISPKTVELGITQIRRRVDLAWSPTMRSYVSVAGSFQDLSDTNERWEITVAPRYGVVRNEHLNLDLGVYAYRLSVLRDLPNGYYDPSKYENYSGMVFPYFKFSENVGLGLSIALGGQRQEAEAFRFGAAGSAEATIGIYKAWVLRLGGSAIHNQRMESGAFDGYTGSVVLSRRF